MTDVGSILLLTAGLTLVVGVVLLITVSAVIGGVVLLVGLCDLALALAFRSGMLGGGS